MVSSFRHPNIIRFIGFCDEAEEMIIISEYASNGSLDHHLANPDWRRRLTWVNRLNICLGAAKGLDYLHSGVGEYDRVIHRDIKSANILLDENMEAKICDFGLSIYGPRNQEDTQVITKPSGTRFYIDPIYNERGVLRKESDIYSFGIVMFELSSGMLAYPDWRSKDANPQLLMNMVRSYYDDRRVDDELDDGIDKLMDPDISDEIYRSSFITFNGIAHECINIKEIKERPSMDKIIRRIEEALFIQVVKKEPEMNPKEHRQTRKGDKVRMVSNLALRENYDSKKVSVKGKVVLMKKNVVAHNVVVDSHEAEVDELLDRFISIQFISAIHADRTTSEEKALRGKLGKPTILEGRISTTKNWERTYEVIFDWEEEMGLPGAFLVKNVFNTEFYLMTLTLENVPRHGLVHFICNSWVYPAKYYTKDRIFFANKAYLPSETPALLRPYREEELVILRGNGTGMLHEWDRVYDYAFYNDLGDPDRREIGRPVIGGSSEYPYPRRGRTGRPPTKTDPKKESRVWPSWGLKMYVPRDERFGQTYELEAILQFRLPVFGFKALNDEFDSFEDVLKFYDTRVKNREGPLLDMILDNTSLEMFKELIRSDGEGLLKCSTPQVIKANESAWSTDEEFAREMLAGVNPVSIQLLKEFPPSSKLDAQLYGNQNSSIRLNHIQENLDGLDVKEMLKANRLFILDHHDSLMPYVKRINATSSKIYATRTLLLLQKYGTLKPIAIELSLPHPYGDNLGAVSEVFTPAREGVDAAIWQLAKTYVAVNDSGIHQLISHWLNTHAVIEPFVIATHRQLSVLHPINKLLHPHFRNTMNINATTRNLFINSGGLLETTLFPGKYSIEMSSKIYNDWVFPNQALPMDLVLRGMAVEDSNSPHGLRLMIEDYPFAVDGLEIWSAIKTWVEEYCKFYYKNDDMVQNDTELQAWWKEVREEGHGDLKHKPWWPKMSSVQDVIDSCTIIIWVSSALHAALNWLST